MKESAEVTRTEDSFYQGFAMALASLAREHGQPTIAADIMRGCGVDIQDLRDAGVEKFDLQPLEAELEARP